MCKSYLGMIQVIMLRPQAQEEVIPFLSVPHDGDLFEVKVYSYQPESCDRLRRHKWLIGIPDMFA